MTQPNTHGIRYAREIPLVDRVQVLVVGGGPAGIAAAISAARAGADTALIERYGVLGGAATVGLVGPFMTSFSDDGSTQVIGGIFDELVRRMEALGGAVHPSKVRAHSPESGFYGFGHDHVTPFDPEAFKLVAAEVALESGVRLRLHTDFVDPILEDRWLRGAIVHSKSGLGSIGADVVIDCTGDADVAYRAGASTVKGRESDGLMQPMTMFFRVGNVDDQAIIDHIAAHPEEEGQSFHALVEQAKAEGRLQIARDKVGLYRSVQPGVWRINTSRMQGLDGTEATDLTRAEVEGRRQVWELMRFFRESLPGFAEAVLLDTAVQVGVRETRRIVGQYVLTADDLATGRHFEDVIALAAFPFDIHPVMGDGGGTTSALEAGLRTANVYEIPYRSLVPQEIEQLLVAGRCLSATHEAAGAVRVMPPCFAMGQAAGVAAARAIRDEMPPSGVGVSVVQTTLRGQGAILEI